MAIDPNKTLYQIAYGQSCPANAPLLQPSYPNPVNEKAHQIIQQHHAKAQATQTMSKRVTDQTPPSQTSVFSSPMMPVLDVKNVAPFRILSDDKYMPLNLRTKDSVADLPAEFKYKA